MTPQSKVFNNPDIMRYIYEFDPTYRNLFKGVLSDVILRYDCYDTFNSMLGSFMVGEDLIETCEFIEPVMPAGRYFYMTDFVYRDKYNRVKRDVHAVVEYCTITKELMRKFYRYKLGPLVLVNGSC